MTGPVGDPTADEAPDTPEEKRPPLARVTSVLVLYGRRHRAPFLKGCLAACLVIAARLGMPWPIHALMHYWSPGAVGRAEVVHPIPGLDWSLTLGLAFLALLVALGLGDAILRVQFARFSIGTVRDIRAAALRAAVAAAGTRKSRPGDMVARLVGDTARIKAGLGSFLVHVAPNGLLFLGVTVILLLLNVKLGLIFGTAGLGTLLATLAGARSMYRVSKKYRKHEGKLADHIDQALRTGVSEPAFAAVNQSSGSHEAALTRIQALTTWATYILFGLAVLAAIWIGSGEIAAGALEPRDMIVFLVYALIIRGPTVRLARQGSRLGKILATALRVVKVLERPPANGAPPGELTAPEFPSAVRSAHGAPVPFSRKTRVLFTGYAPVHYLCFRPLYERMRTLDGVEVFLSGGIERTAEAGVEHDEKALYGPLGVPMEQVLSVAQIKEQDFDFLFTSSTTLIEPRSVRTKVQIFHGVSFRNRAIRPKNMSCDHYFLIGPYMERRFVESGLLQADDPRAVRVGFMKTDALRNGSLDRKRLLAQAGFDGSRPTLLYAPTGLKGNSLETMGEEVLERLAASERFDVLVKLHDHPRDTDTDWPAKLSRLESPHFQVSRELDVVKLLFLADILVTDASSVSSEFSLLDRSMVFLDVPDLLQKAGKKSDSMLDLDTWGRRAGTVVTDPSTIVEVVSGALARPEVLGEIRCAMAADLFFNPGTATDHAFEWFKSAAAAPRSLAPARAC